MHKARKRFGQNFLTDESVIQRILLAISPEKHDHIIEIGPGLGALTFPLLEILKQFTVIEIDRDLVLKLKELNNPKLRVIQEDILKFDLATLSFADKFRIVGNLPYNISSPLLLHLLKSKKKIRDMYFMLLKELVDRICAVPNNKSYGRLSVIIQAQCEVENLFTVPAMAFQPAPKVESAMIKVKPKANDDNLDLAVLEKLVKTTFAQRRKTLRNNLRNMLSNQQLSTAPIDLSLRAENISVSEYINFSKWFGSL